MATEHEINRGEQKDLQMDGEIDMLRGWVDSPSCRSYPASSWRPWGDDDTPSSAGDAELSGDGRAHKAAEIVEDGSAKTSEAAEDNWGRASESVEDGWGEVTHGADSPKATWGRVSESAGDEWDSLYDAGSESEECEEAESSRQCSGLTNLGNTCFMNSVLQCLTYTVPLANRILASQHRASCKAQEFCAMCAVENHMKVVLSASGRTVSPAFLARNLDQISRSFIPGQQQDAHEFLYFLLEGMQKFCKTDGSFQPQSIDNSLVSDIFMGQMKSQVKCKACSHSSDSVEPFLGLNLEIENCYSVKEALSNFLAVEELQEEDKVLCSHCKEAAGRSKQLSFSKSPQVLVVQLKRYKASEFFPTKIERDIKYDLSLDLTPFVSQQEDAKVPDEDSDWKYSLYAVLVHSGWSTSSGHYYCFVQTCPGVWHCMNDSLVSRSTKRTVLHQEAYILFYIRKGIKETLQLENALSANQDLEVLEGLDMQVSERVSDPYPCYSPVQDDSAFEKRPLLKSDVKDPVVLSQAGTSSPSGPSYQVQVEIEAEANIVCSQVKSPTITKQVVDKDDSVTSTGVDAHQALKHCPASSSKRKVSLELEDPKHSVELEEPKPCVKLQSSVKVERTSTPSPTTGCNQAVFNSFEKGSHYSYVRLLNRMPSTRRQALLASAMSGQEALHRSNPKASNASQSKPASASKQSHLLQAGMGRATSRLLQKEEPQSSKGRHGTREKPWAEEHDHINSRKLQRVGGKRVMASCRDSTVH